MKIVFVYWGYDDAGSMLDLQGYQRAALDIGHEVIVYGPPNPRHELLYSKVLDDADAVVFVFEWTTCLKHGDLLDWVRLVASIPRRRRVVIDCDGAYNAPIEVDGDYNHTSTAGRMSWVGSKWADERFGRTTEYVDAEASSRAWIEFCDSLSDKILQPTPRPRRANVGTFFFHIYDPTWETPLDFTHKELDMVYVGHTKFRWHGMSRVLRAVEPVRDRLGRIALVGEGWAKPSPKHTMAAFEDNFYCDRSYLAKLGVEALPPVPFSQVIGTMSRAVFNPVIYRPLFAHLEMVTCRTFETAAAGTIPLFLLGEDYIREIYGERATALCLGDQRAPEKVLDVLARPGDYAQIVHEVRRSFARLHSPRARLRELLDIIEG
ncbi:glycosyltransferase family protein [Paraliomyxa miuraensis]|uniref:glycosyltransferase family protein n=1 Tax=Paraliomyxa miuraensis TaxID=376150 RepID=UPI00225B048F|nr:glycosyltransferase [Paraliomyxa miuraensis]MCX4243151.1 glycosyltransferase [Paraliomyxa miuraensis]